MKTLQIGIATITYAEDGHVISAKFDSLIDSKVPKSAIKQLARIEHTDDEENVRQNGEIILANWFNKLNNIELADRDKFKIASTTQKCERWENGMIKECSILFTFEELVAVPSA